MKILDNINHTVREDLQDTMQKGSRVSIAAACFSIYAYQELKKQLEEISELRFIFTSPTFVQENTPKERREFYIPKLTREKSLYGTEFEVRLRNELTQKALAKECADWVRRKVKFRSNVSGEHKVQAWIGCKDTSANSSAKVSRYLHTDWMPETELSLAISGLSLEAVYDGLVRQIARLQGESWSAAYSIADNIQRSAEREKLQKQIAALENKIRKEKQFNRQVEMNAELKQLRRNLENML